MKTLLVTICKNENHYIKEYIKYYKKLGFTNIVIGDNNDLNGENFDSILKDEIENGYVVIKNYRGKHQQQITFYNDMYKEYNTQFDWIAFFDADEYLTLCNCNTIDEFLTDKMFNNFQVIRLNWVCYGDNGLIRVVGNDYSVQRRFVTPLPMNLVINGVVLNKQSKTIVRGGNKKVSISVHGENSLPCCNDCGVEIKSNWYTDNFSNKNAYLKHYNTKTIEEWLNKIKRGYADKNWNNKRMLSVERFFMYNKKTPEKINFLKKLGYKI